MAGQVKRLLARLRNALRPELAEADLTREVASHLGLLEDAYRARGLSPAEARLAALRQFGPVERVKSLQRDERSLPWVDDARQDVRELVRAGLRRPWATVSAATLIALAVAGTTTLGSVVYGVLFRPLAWPDGDSLIRIEETRGGQRGRIPWTISNATYLAWMAKAETGRSARRLARAGAGDPTGRRTRCSTRGCRGDHAVADAGAPCHAGAGTPVRG